MRVLATFRASRRQPWLQVAKSAVATIVAWLVAGWLIPGPLPVFAAIAALLVVQPSLNQSVAKAIERSVGVVAGVVIASALALAFGQATWVVLVAVVAALAVAWALRMTTGTSNQVAISALLVLALGAATPDYALDRVLETVIGAVIGFIVNLAFVPPVALAPAQRTVDALGGEVAASLDRLATALGERQTPAQLEELMLTARLMRPMVQTATDAIASAAESLTLNPRARRRREELRRLEATLARLGPIVTQVIGMTRAVYDRYDTGLAEEPTVRAIAEQLRRAAHDVRRVMRRTSAEPGDPPTQSIPALTSPLVIGAPSSGHWILVGSLLEDLRRIHETLAESAD
ncbi:FUSC family protein [Protaetiibacter mangrovi]|uniref:Aromatic acid exporter family protein n=1 Tax=Protaetiibacter mangrovi TaxID=2970926 RepID=A0ABT1ZGJ5_9MICO|nr:aromatic acid exporter family protein [Protaetiibacter mangrovi]MCS0499750.1 aromatic acid exporter family protein [Protaetiibacter mangrovi]TPX02370.1 FUSC family protein [Schumannella luteola]